MITTQIQAASLEEVFAKKRDQTREFREVSTSYSKLIANVPKREKCSNCGGEGEASGICHFCGMEQASTAGPKPSLTRWRNLLVKPLKLHFHGAIAQASQPPKP